MMDGVSVEDHAISDALMERTAPKGFYYLMVHSEFKEEMKTLLLSDILKTKEKTDKFNRILSKFALISSVLI